MKRAAIIAVTCAMCPALGAGPALAQRAAHIETGIDYLAACGAQEAGYEQECRNPLLAEVFKLQARGAGPHNPFTPCPVDIRRVEALEELGAKLHHAFLAWLKSRDAQLQRRNIETLVSSALAEIDVCRLQ